MNGRVVGRVVGAVVVEGDNVDLLAMGRPEGPGCYCPANNALRMVLDHISDQYPFVVMDNEAGLEHLSRRTTRSVEHLLVVTDSSYRAVVAAQRVAELVTELKIGVDQTHVIVNRLPDGKIPPPLHATINTIGVPLLGVVPEDAVLREFDLSGRPLVEMGDESPVYQAVAEMMAQRLGIKADSKYQVAM